MAFVEPNPQYGRGVTWYEIYDFLSSIDPVAAGAAGYFGRKAIDKIVDEFYAWVKRRRKRRGSSRRPAYARIYGPDGELLKAILVDENGRKSDKTDEEKPSEDKMRKSVDQAKNRKSD